MELRYCILHEAMVETECEPICGHIDEYLFDNPASGYEYSEEIDFCEFPLGYAFAPMPEAPDIELIAAFDRPYTVDLLEYHARTMQEEAELLVEMITQEV